jgi:peptidylprolyl isomerase
MKVVVKASGFTVRTRAAALAAVLLLASASTARAQAPPDVLPEEDRTPPADAVTSDSGLVTAVLVEGTGTEHPAADDIVTVQYSAWREADGRLFDSTVLRGMPAMFPLDGALRGWQECVRLMTPGETRRCWLPEELAYGGEEGRPAGTLVFDVELIDAHRNPLVPPSPLDRPAEDAVRTPSGLFYKVLRAGTGTRHPAATSAVTVHYSGWTVNGRLFDSSIASGMPATFLLSNVIDGWTEGVQLMVEGERRRFWIPEDLAYKGEGGGPRGTLVFDIELIRIQ